MKYLPYEATGTTPNIVVDGYGNDATVLTLSHWPGSKTPAHLKADASAEIVLRWLEVKDPAVTAEVVTNNHFDEDGLTGVWSVIHPEEALARKALVADVACAGDFNVYRARDAARIALACAAFGSYEEGLPKLLDLLDHPEKYRSLWETGDAAITEGEARLDRGDVRIEEAPEIDLAIVRFAETLPSSFDEACHPMALYTRTPRTRLLLVQGRRYEFRYRYESWVQYASRPIPPRVDLAPLAKSLSKRDSTKWTFDGVETITPSMSPRGESRIDPATLEAEVRGAFATSSTSKPAA